MDLYHVEMDSQLTLTSLHWADILFVHVLPYLDVEDLFNLRETSHECMEMIDNYFGEMTNLRLDQFNFAESHFKILSLTCHNLRKLIIHNCDDVSEDDLKYLLDHNRKIRHIDLSSCCKLTSLCLHPVVIHFKDLNALILNNSIWFTTGCLEAFTLHHSKLEILELSQCSSLGNVSAINCFLVKCKDLHTLNLSGIDCICDSTMETLSHFNCKLQILDVKFCPRITGYGIRMLIQYCNKLRKLSVVGCSSAAQRFAYDGRVNDVPLLEVEADAEYSLPVVRGVPPLMLQI